jgi:RNA recognition motif-containing protein
MRLYVGNIPWSATNEDLHQRFGAHGNVTDARIITDRETQRSRGFGFVTFENDDDANDALREENGAEFQGRTLRVSEAQEKKPSSRGGNGHQHRGGGNGHHSGGGHDDSRRRRSRSGGSRRGERRDDR